MQPNHGSQNKQRAAVSGRSSPKVFAIRRRPNGPDGAGKPGSRVDRLRVSYSQEPDGRAGRDLAGPAAGRPDAWHIPTPVRLHAALPDVAAAASAVPWA